MPPTQFDGSRSALQIHAHNTADYAAILAQTLSRDFAFIDDVYIQRLKEAALWHDVGKEHIPDAILNSPNKLSEEEWKVMTTHPLLGIDIIEERARGYDAMTLSMIKEVTLCHHEHVDGTGYPHGKSRDEIPFSARIVAVADAFDALTTERSYKVAFSFVQAKAMLLKEKGRCFDEKVIAAFIESEALLCEALNQKTSE